MGTRKVRRRQTKSVQAAETADTGENSHGVNNLCKDNSLLQHGAGRGNEVTAPHALDGYYQFECRSQQATGDELLAIQLLTKILLPECQDANYVDYQTKQLGTSITPNVDAVRNLRLHQIPLSLPVIRNATAAADAR